MSKLTIREQLEKPKLRESLLDRILKKIADKKIKAKKGEIKDLLKGMYGSEDKIPQYRKDFFNL